MNMRPTRSLLARGGSVSSVARGYQEPGEKPRRFYKAAEAGAVEGGFGVTLDSRTLSTPKGAKLVLPTLALAQQVAAEWAAQGEHIDLAAMAVTRLANTAIEAIPAARDAVAQQIADYAGSDLLCYRAEGPEGLLARQTEAWDPALDRARRELGVRLICGMGIVHQAQPDGSLDRVRALALTEDDFGLAGLAFATPLFGSAVLALGLRRSWFEADRAFDLSRLDEAFQEELWGIDAEAGERTARLRAEAQMVQAWFEALPSPAGIA